MKRFRSIPVAKPKRRTDREVIDELHNNTPLNKARTAFSSAVGQQEQRIAQHKNTTPIELRRMEFEAVEAILTAYGVQLPDSEC